MLVCIVQTGRPALALSGKRSLDQYVHTAWGADKGYIGGSIAAIAQSSDGYLWLGTDRGLIRFDGYEFTLIERRPGRRPMGPVRGLVQDSEGNLWVRLNGPWLLHYRDGKFQEAAAKFEIFDSAFTAMGRDLEGNLLLWGAGHKTLQFHNGVFSHVIPKDSINSFVTAVLETAPGSMWLATRDSGLHHFQDGRFSQVIPENVLLAVNVLAPGEEGGVWIGSENGLHLWENGRHTEFRLPDQAGKSEVQALLRDRHHNLWVGTGSGLYRIDPVHKLVTGFYRSSDDPAVSALYEDKEGNIWFAGARGLERLRDGMFTTISQKQTGLKEMGGPVFVDEGGTAWFAPLSGGLYRLQNGNMQRMAIPELDNDVIYSITGSRNELWLGRQKGGLTQLIHWGGGWILKTYTRSNGLAQNSVFTVTRSHDGTIWAGTVSGGISQFKNNRFSNYNVDTGLQSNAIFSSLETSDGKMWFASSSGLVCFDQDRWTTYSVSDVGQPLNLRNVFEDSGHVLWVGTSQGLARFQHNRVERAVNLPQALNEEVLGIGEDKHGFLWIATSDHVVQIDRGKLLAGALKESDVLSYGLDDGLTENGGIRRDRSIVSDAFGRIWIPLPHSLAMADVDDAEAYRLPGRVRFDSVSLENGSELQGHDLVLPAGTSNITFRYSGMNMSMPQRMQFRYLLAGVDHDWSSDASFRQVVYNHLSPGNYTFRIMGSNALGMWNGPETDITFRIQPAFWQTWYFEILLLLFITAGVISLYRFRVLQVKEQLNQRFQDRLAERTRIAQDLHDTLLQGVISASMQLDVAQDHLPEDSSAKPQLRRVLQLMRQVTDEGRAALRGLRTIDSSVSLEDAFKRLANELPSAANSDVKVHLQGSPRPLKPVVLDEAYRIGREAYRNAVSHARANRVEILVEYGTRKFRLTIMDDGCGIDSKTLREGREGHWGLAGMKERAKAIGSVLNIRTRTPGGTEVELLVPSGIAYPRSPRRFKWPWKTDSESSGPEKETRVKK